MTENARSRSKYVIEVNEADGSQSKLNPKADSESESRKAIRAQLESMIGQHRNFGAMMRDYDSAMARLDQDERVMKSAQHRKFEGRLRQLEGKLRSRRAEHFREETRRQMSLEQKLQAIAQDHSTKLAQLEADFRKEHGEQNESLQRLLSRLRTRATQGDWQELLDPTTSQVYYLNTSTGHSQWEKPSEMYASSGEVAAVTCAICLDVVQGQAMQCANGHLFCGDCLSMHLQVSANHTCPTCRAYVEGEGTRNIVAEELAKRLQSVGLAAMVQMTWMVETSTRF